MSKNILFITETLFKERTGASNAIDGKQLFPMIKVAQDMYIMPTLGSALYNRLQNGIENDNLIAAEVELLNDYVTDTLIWYTMSMLPMVMGFQLFSKGFLQKTSEESSAPSRSDLELIENKYKSMAEYYNTQDEKLESILLNMTDRKKTFINQISKSFEIEVDFEIQTQTDGKPIWIGLIKI